MDSRVRLSRRWLRAARLTAGRAVADGQGTPGSDPRCQFHASEFDTEALN